MKVKLWDIKKQDYLSIINVEFISMLSSDIVLEVNGKRTHYKSNAYTLDFIHKEVD